MTEVTVETQPSQFDLLKQEAHTKIATMTLDDIAGLIANRNVVINQSQEANSALRTRLQKLVDNVTEFIKDNLEDGCGTQELKDLAEELDISLTKDMTISFTVKYYADITVPLDFDTDKIDESDFRISIEFQGNDNDIDWDNDSTEVEDFEIEEN